MILVGAVSALDGLRYAMGTLQKMGPGYFPVALGSLLIFLGILIAGTASTGAPEKDDVTLTRSEWRGWFCIIAGPTLFIIFGQLAGLLPATFACVFVSALGDRDTNVKEAAILAAGVTVFGIILFHYLLKIPLPILNEIWT